ncbi:MAG: hypothetical protein JXQ75_13815 [Phycisphaerae bacterium]|nr:hypothetical protein [Phycisphaerae bacterium]
MSMRNSARAVRVREGLESVFKRQTLFMALVVMTLAWAQGVRADLSAPQSSCNEASAITISPSDVGHLPEQPSRATASQLRQYPACSKTGAAVCDLDLGSSQGDWTPFAAIEDEASNASSAQVREVPPLPSSAVLFLSAVLSAGAWHLGRSAMHLHLGALPEWYHAGGPDQIGHAVPFDFDFSASPPCRFEQPVGERPFRYRVRREETPRCDEQANLTIAAPRGPPALPF